MAGLNNQSIVSHEFISAHVTVTAYEDGTRVYVNHGSSDVQCEGACVPARSYLVVGRDQQ